MRVKFARQAYSKMQEIGKPINYTFKRIHVIFSGIFLAGDDHFLITKGQVKCVNLQINSRPQTPAYRGQTNKYLPSTFVEVPHSSAKQSAVPTN